MSSEHTMRPDDTLMSAWLDGEVEGADDERVQAWLREHPEDAARVRLWAADRDALRARLAPMLDEPVPERLQHVVRQHRRDGALRGPWLQAAMAAGLFVAGALIGALWMRAAPAERLAEAPRWTQRAAIAHAVFAPEERHPVEVSVRTGDAAQQREQEQHLARWLTRRLAVDVRLFDLRDHGFELVGGRLLADANGPSAQLMYQDAGGQRVTVYMRKAGQDVPAAFAYERSGNLGLFYWVEGHCGYALVGPLPREQLLALAQAIHRQDAEAESASAPKR
ncbi:MAG: anti-sigma factor [Burkholderiaceae bacterium]